jgi:integrase
LSKALNEAVKHGLVIQNVAAVEKAPKVQADEMVILTSEQVSDLAAKLRGHAMYAEAITALFTGLRRGELLALRWKNVDVDNEKAIRVREALEQTRAFGLRFKTPKTKAGRRDVSLPEVVIEALREHRRQQLEIRMALGLGKLSDEGLVFPAADGEPQSPRVFSNKWKLVRKTLGLGRVPFHALRHTHASQLIDAGIDIVTISRRLGHASPTITLGTYAHLFRQRDDKAAKAINDALAGFGKA